MGRYRMFNNLQEYEIYLESYTDLLMPLCAIGLISELLPDDLQDKLSSEVRKSILVSIYRTIDIDRINAQSLLYYSEHLMELDSEDLVDEELFDVCRKGYMDPSHYKFDYQAIDTRIYKGKELITLTNDAFKERMEPYAKKEISKIYVEAIAKDVLADFKELLNVSTHK